MWELDCEESWVLKNSCFWTVVLEKTLESPLDCKEIQPVHSKGDKSWVFFERTDAEAETPILWPPHVKSWLIGKDFDAGRDWGQEEKGTTKNDIVGQHHWLDRMSLSKLQELVMDREARHATVLRVTKSWTQLSDWTELIFIGYELSLYWPPGYFFEFLFINFYISPFWSSYFSQSNSNQELILLSTAFSPTCKKGLSLGLMSHIRRKVHKLKTYWCHIQLIRIVRKENS